MQINNKMNPNSAQTLCQIGIVVFVILSALCTFGNYYYGKQAENRQAVLTNQINTSPAIRVSIDEEKNVSIENIGIVDIKDVELSLMKYIFDETLYFKKEHKIKDYVRIDSFKKIGLLQKKDKVQNIDLLHIGQFYDNPGKENNNPIVTHYCIEITLRNSVSGERFGCFLVTSAMKGGWKAPYEKNVTYRGGFLGTFMQKTKQFIIEDQKKIIGNDFKIISCD